MRRWLFIGGVALALAQAGAGAGGGNPLTKKEVKAAKKLYESKCAKCHCVREPRDYSQEEWELWMARMCKKARLSPKRQKLLSRYLEAYRAADAVAQSASAAAGSSGGSGRGRGSVER